MLKQKPRKSSKPENLPPVDQQDFEGGSEEDQSIRSDNRSKQVSFMTGGSNLSAIVGNIDDCRQEFIDHFKSSIK